MVHGRLARFSLLLHSIGHTSKMMAGHEEIWAISPPTGTSGKFPKVPCLQPPILSFEFHDVSVSLHFVRLSSINDQSFNITEDMADIMGCHAILPLISQCQPLWVIKILDRRAVSSLYKKCKKWYRCCLSDSSSINDQMLLEWRSFDNSRCG